MMVFYTANNGETRKRCVESHLPKNTENHHFVAG